MNISELKIKLSSFFSEHQEIIFAYLFGSTVKNVVNKNSDIDLAVYFSKSMTDSGYILMLISELIDHLKTDKVHLVQLNDNTLTLQYLVQKEGNLIYSQDEERRINFEIITRKLFWDYQPKIRCFEESLIKRLERINVA